jgi:uncharacterized protein YyaL (SSP411 family)
MTKGFLSVLVFVLGVAAPVYGAEANALQGHASPYLAMHGQDPVQWREWSPEVLAQAKAENKLLFVSIGYFSCHWCHVMQRESFRNPDIAHLLNEHFISVKVDRELHPALDATLIDFVQRTRGMAGWPLNVFLTPEGHPLVGMVYVPPKRFQALLEALHEQWRQGSDYLKQVALRAAQSLKAPARETTALPPVTPAVAGQIQDVLIQQAQALGDNMDGGFGEQTKFPMAPQLLALLSAYERTPHEGLRPLLRTTLDRMASQGLRDQLGGGFFRYTTDPGWQMPHFEKMLYDNALLARVYLKAARVFTEPRYAMIARNTLDFMVREMLSPEGGMVASFSAVDEAGVEGGYYLWREETLKALLDKQEWQIVRTLWGLEGTAAWEAGYLPRQVVSPEAAARELGLSVEALRRVWGTAREKMLAVRSKRHLPIDGKRLAAWNGLALTALVEGLSLEELSKKKRAIYESAAGQVRDYLVQVLWDGRRLSRAVDRRPDGGVSALGQAGIDDYAFVAEGLLAWSRRQKDEEAETLAQILIEEAWRRFYDDTGWRLSDQTLLPTGFGVPVLEEGPLPSAAATLQRLTGQILASGVKSAADREHWHQRLERSLAAAAGLLQQQAFDFPSHANVLAGQYP